MNRLFLLLLTGSLLCVALAPVGAKEEGKDGEPGMHEHHGGPWKMMGFTDEEAAKMKEAFKAERTAMKPLRREMRDARIKLRDLVEDKAGDKDLTAALDRVESAKKALRAEGEKFHAKLAAGMTPLQRAKAALFMSRHRMGMKGGHGMMGRHGEGEKHEGWGGHGGGDDHEHGMRFEEEDNQP